LNRYRAGGTIFDLIVVDYVDITAPDHRSELKRENPRSIFIDLRAIAFENKRRF
jgi:replicative DNA helicase